MQESIAFLVRVLCRRKESSRSLSHLLMSFLLKMAAGSHIGFDLGNVRLPTATKCNLSVSAWSSNLVLIRFIVLKILRFLYFAVLA